MTDIQNCVDDTKQCLEKVEGFSHPCGGPGWRPAVNLDMSVPGAQCPSGWSTEILSSGNYCVGSYLFCSTASIEISEPCNQVCGRVHAYSVDSPGGFSLFSLSGGDVNIGVSEIIARGGDEHVFSFVAGSPTGSPANQLCPCLSGDTLPLPHFLNGDYFCETATSDPSLTFQVSIWDGLNCEPGSQCCDNGCPTLLHQDTANS